MCQPQVFDRHVHVYCALRLLNLLCMYVFIYMHKSSLKWCALEPTRQKLSKTFNINMLLTVLYTCTGHLPTLFFGTS